MKGCLFPPWRDEKRAEIIPIEPDAGNAVAGRFGKTIDRELPLWLADVRPFII